MNSLFSSDARLFGLRIWRKRLSDTEIVDRLRKQVRARRWFRAFFALFGIFALSFSVWAIQAILNFLNNWGVPPGQQNFVNVAFGAAIIVGVSIGFGMGSMVHTAATGFFGGRQEKLLVDCWDALNRLLDERSTASNLPPEEVESDAER